ncbi:hypothetical protein D918_04026 [Trichuris suis]|nr:hypothetical protein D918_04026 [Trichuris suis]
MESSTILAHCTIGKAVWWMHLFDINIPGKIVYRESDVITPGAEPVIFRTEFADIGLGICYDVRFPQLALAYASKGCQLLVYPSAFSVTTGSLHWMLLSRSRAVDTLSYVAMCSPARNEAAKNIAYGYSTVVDPWGKTIAAAAEEENIVYADISSILVKKGSIFNHV